MSTRAGGLLEPPALGFLPAHSQGAIPVRPVLVWNNRQSWTSLMRRMAGEQGLGILEEAVGRAAIRTQRIMRENLERMVYAQPSSASGYVRTRTLMRATRAAAPGTNHSGDESRAAGGEDLAATEASEVVKRRGAQISSEVGAWINYASYVHEGVRQPSPRPFVTEAEQGATNAMNSEVERALIRLGGIR